MRKQAIWLMIPAVALACSACKKKEVAAPAPQQAAAVEAQAPAANPPSVTRSLSADERAAKLGFVKHLPKETEVVMAFHNGSKSAARIQSTKLWKLVQSQMGMGMPMAPGGDEEMEEGFEIPDVEQDTAAQLPDAADGAGETGPAALFGTEFTIALGKTVGEQTSNLLTLNSRMGYFQMRSLAQAFVGAAKSGDFSGVESSLSNQYGAELLKDLLADPEAGVGLFEKLNMPPLYLAFRSSPAGLDAATQQLAALTENLAILGEMVEPIETEKAGRKFSGHKISGQKVSAAMAGEREAIEEMLDSATVDKLIAAVAKKDLVVLSGSIGDYAILFIGSSVDDLSFAADPGQSLAASDAMAFCDAYASKELAAVIYGQKEAIQLMATSAGGLADMATGLRDGLSGAEGLGDTRDLETLLRMVADREAGLLALAGTEAVGVAAFFEDGLKIESFGGTDQGALDWKSPNKLAALGDSEEVVMFANMTTEAAYDEKLRAYGEALLETSYAAAMKIAELPLEDEKMVQFKEMAKMFDTRFRPDAVAMWETFSGDYNGSLGQERAWVMDLNGSVPAIPGIPQAVVDAGKFPRITMVAPVADRAKLATSWQSMNTSLTGVLAKIGEMTGKEIPMQKPISSEKDGNTTWFFPMPFFNDDFLPSVTVGDRWFAASTSKNQALDLVSKASTEGQARTGLWFSMNFKALGKFSEETLALLEKNSEALGVDANQMKESAKFIAALDDLDKLTVHARREGGVLRSSVHLKSR